MGIGVYEAGEKGCQETFCVRFESQSSKIAENPPKKSPFQSPPPYEKLVGDLAGAYSRRINIQHRLVYQVYEKEQTVKVIRLWTHYE